MSSDSISPPGAGAAPNGLVPAQVVSHRRLTPERAVRDLRHLVLQPTGAPIAFREGQFLGLQFPAAPEAGVAMFSIASARSGETPGRNDLALLVKHADDDTDASIHLRAQLLSALKAGDEIALSGPYGEAFLPAQGPAPMLMIATGTGIAPMRAVLQQLLREPRAGERLLLFGARGPEDAAYVDELMRLAPETAQLRFAWSRQSERQRRYVHDEIRAAASSILRLLDDPDLSVCLCGVPAMEAEVEQALSEVCEAAQLHWADIRAALQARGALHVQTY